LDASDYDEDTVEVSDPVFGHKAIGRFHYLGGRGGNPVDAKFSSLAGILSDLCLDSVDSLLCALDGLPEWRKAFITAALPIEQEQQQSWFTSLSQIVQHQILTFPTTVNGEEHIIAKSRDIIDRHRFGFNGRTSSLCTLVVTGPKLSGKSTFLLVFARVGSSERDVCFRVGRGSDCADCHRHRGALPNNRAPHFPGIGRPIPWSDRFF
jgi:hypothetical protein